MGTSFLAVHSNFDINDLIHHHSVVCHIFSSSFVFSSCAVQDSSSYEDRHGDRKHRIQRTSTSVQQFQLACMIGADERTLIPSEDVS